MLYDEEYYQALLENMVNTLAETANEVLTSHDQSLAEDFVDKLGHLIIEFGGEWDGDDARI